ncbi:PAS domain-containing response regulator [Salinigranum halophilum]|uniref:PAS domain-containing response regulator n=1 Tax=Salinigranum halophilum TaxID=2565931 RepID=UPI00115DD5AF|nr:response regulator [Salinigranum halophilum]
MSITIQRRQSGCQIRILHVDDDPAFADLTATYLGRESDQFTIETATCPANAFETFDLTAFDCIVSDFDMPGQNGIEFLRTVRAQYPDLPFILYTGKGSEDVASDAISAGVTEYLQKGRSTEQYALLANRIRNVVSKFHAEAQVDQVESQLRDLTEATSDLLWMFSSDWEELLYVNSAYEDIWGYAVDDLFDDPRSFLERIHPADRNDVEEAMISASEGKPIDIEYRVTPAERTQRWVWVQATPIVDSSGTVRRIAGFGRDITERKHREQDAARTAIVLETVVDELSTGVLVEDAGREIIAANDALCNLFDVPVSCGELVGRDCARAAAELRGLFADSDGFIDRIEELLDRREPVHGERIQLADGRTLERDYIPYTLPGGAANLWLYRDMMDSSTGDEQH